MSRIYISHLADKRVFAYLDSHDSSLHTVISGGRTYQAIDAHPDIYFCKMGVTFHKEIFIGDPEEIGAAYPDNIRFNAVCLDRYLIHRLKNTSPALLSKAREIGLEMINVNQGYTKCNCVVVDGSAIITSDAGIYNTLQNYPAVSVLKIRPGFVRLDGFEYGFLGGASGRVDDEIIFNGDLSAHPDFEAISRFIESRGVKIKYFPDFPLTDIGSILSDS